MTEVRRPTTARRPFAAFVHKAVDLNIVTAPDRVAELAQALDAVAERLALVPDRTGLLVVFLDTGFNSCVFEGLRPASFSEPWRAKTVALKNELSRRLNSQSVRLITPVDLERIIASAPPPPAPCTLPRWFAGESPRPLYDGPKLVKWLFAVANMERDIPVCTFDEDVLRLAPDLAEDRDGLFTPSAFAGSLARLLDEHDRLADSGRSLVISGQYLSADRAAALLPGGPAPGASWELDALNGSATRTLFLAGDQPGGSPGALQLAAVRAFFGSLGTPQVSGLGAPAFGVPVSGAGLIQSNSLTRNAPMFSLLRQNLVYVDDYLRALIAASENSAEIRVAADAVFLKPRVHVDMRELSARNSDWHLGAYLPGLVLGTVATAWITSGAWRSDGQPANDPKNMWKVALERLKFVVECWGDPQLASTCVGSFVAGKRTAPYAPQGLRAAVARLAVEYPGPIDKLAADSSLEDRLRALVQDFIDYPTFAEYWRDQFVPAFLQEAALDQPWRFA